MTLAGVAHAAPTTLLPICYTEQVHNQTDHDPAATPPERPQRDHRHERCPAPVPEDRRRCQGAHRPAGEQGRHHAPGTLGEQGQQRHLIALGGILPPSRATILSQRNQPHALRSSLPDPLR